MIYEHGTHEPDYLLDALLTGCRTAAQTKAAVGAWLILRGYPEAANAA